MPLQQGIDGSALLALARQTIVAGLEQHCLCLPAIEDCPREWQQKRASFVTLQLAGDLRGCIGTLEADEALAVNVARNAYNAAFNDPRFPPLDASEYPQIRLNVSLLTVPIAVDFASETELLAALTPGSDGLIIEHGRQRATFLPSVWDSLTTAAQFLRVLKEKAGLPATTVPERAWRYRTETWHELNPLLD